MISPHVKHYLTEHLRGLISCDDAKEVLRLIDDSGSLVAEFDKVLGDVSQKIPGLAINFEKLLSSDEFECDPLISQGNLALLRLDTIYYQAFEAWKKSGGDLHRFKHITKAENPATYSGSTEKHERTDENYPPNAQLLNQLVNITLSAFRVQATITHRREHLRNPNQSTQLVSRDAARSAFSPRQNDSSQPEASARNAAQSNPDIIGPNEILNTDFDDFSVPIDGKFPLLIRGINKISLLKGYNQFEPLTKTTPVAQSAPAKSPATVAIRSAKERPATDNACVPSLACDTPQSEHVDTTNNVSPEPREEEPAILAPTSNHRSLTSHQPQSTSRFSADPPFHQRE